MDVKTAPKKVLATRIRFQPPKIDMKLGTALLLTIGAYAYANNGDGRQTGEALRSDSQEHVLPVVMRGVNEAGGFVLGIIDGEVSTSEQQGVTSEAPALSESVQTSSSGALMRFAGIDCTSGEYSLSAGVWGALERANFGGNIADAVAANPQAVTAAENGAQTISIICE